MIKNKFTFLLYVVLSAVFSASAIAADTVKIAENGKALATVEIAPQASVYTRSVAMEMADYLEQMTGAPFNVSNAPGAGTRIVLGRNNEFPNLKYGDKLRGNGQEAFLMRTEGDKVLLLGVTDRAASHAAYTFLEKLGVRWFFPMKDWEVVPSLKTVTVNLDEVQSPDMALHRSIWYGGIHSGFDVNHLRSEWVRHNRMKLDGPRQSHTWVGLDPKKDFAEHPEWFALVGDKRRTSKPNYGHPEVIKKAVQYGLNGAKAGADSISVSAPDGLGFCECDQCLQVAGVSRESIHKISGGIFGKRPDGTLVCVTSETIFRMANEVAKAVGKDHPNVLVVIYAYSGYAHPPSFDLEPNVYVPVTSSYRRTPLSFEDQIQIYGEKAKQIGIYDYYNIAAWHGFKPNKGQKIDQIQDRMKFYHENRVRGVVAEATNNWGSAGLDFYMASKLMWDVDTDVDAVYADFLEKAFGAAKEPMKSYYDRWESKVELSPAAIGAAIDDLITAYNQADTEAAKTRIAQLYLYMRFVRLDLQRSDKSLDPEVVDQASQDLADLAWRMKDLKLLHEWFTVSVNRPMVPAFTVQEIESLMTQDSKWLQENEGLFLTYSRNLVPITTAANTVPGVQQQPITVDKFRAMQLIVPAKAGETVVVGVKPSEATTSYQVTYMPTDQFQSSANRALAEEVTKGDTADKVSFKTAKTGYYRIVLGQVDGVTSISHPHAMDGGEQALMNATLYFYVPKGTEEFTMTANAQNGPTVKVRDATGKVVFEQDGYTVTNKKGPRILEAEIKVPAGTDGTVWSLTGPGASSSRSSVRLTGVPEYFSFSPNQLLVAEEYLKN